MSDLHMGVYQDRKLQAQNIEVVKHDSTLMLCLRCHGTGNEFFSMYRKCSQCGGVGVVDREVSDE